MFTQIQYQVLVLIPAVGPGEGGRDDKTKINAAFCFFGVIIMVAHASRIEQDFVAVARTTEGRNVPLVPVP